jgi:hypothetical protein
MQCPNCYTEASPRLPRCPRCNTPFRRQSPPDSFGYDAARQRRRDTGYQNGYHGSEYENGYGDAYDDPWEPSPQWQAEWRPGRGTEPWPIAEPGRVAEPWRPKPTGRSRHPFLVAMIAGVVIGTVLAGVLLFWPGGDPSATQPGSAASVSDGSGPLSPHDQATAINALLDEMAASRTALAPAIAEASRCDGIDGAIEQLDRVKEERQNQLNTARELKVDALPNGKELRAALTRAAGYSLDADEAFLAWAKANQGCRKDETPRDEHFERGRRLSSDRASPEKKKFVSRWNQIAEEQGLPTRTADKF